jgi:hypothetical protein
MSAMTAADREWDLLAAALIEQGVWYVGPHARPRGRMPVGEELFERLAQSSHARLREAIVLLLLRRPELARDAQRAIGRLEDRVQMQAKLRYCAACALQRMWRTRLIDAIGDHPLIEPAFQDELRLPPLDEDFGLSALLAISNLEEELFGYNAWAGYESLMGHFLGELAVRARAR